MKHLRLLGMLMLLACAYMNLQAQKAPIKFGKINIEDLEQKQYKIDTSAIAIVLCQYGEFDPVRFEFTHTIRVKILKEEGKKFGNWKFPSPFKAMVKGKTFNLVDGEVSEEKLTQKSIFREKFIYDLYYMNVAMPNVKVGSIIDIEFTHMSIPRKWYFQKDIPVLHSELRIGASEYIKFQRNFFGYIPLHTNESDRWVAKNVPAFVEEPHINSAENYISKFEFEISAIHIPGKERPGVIYLPYYEARAKTWETVNKYLYELPWFGVTMRNPNFFLKGIADHIDNLHLSEKDKVIAAIDTLQKIVGWNDLERFYSSHRDLRHPFSKGIGNSSDINQMLYSLLKRLKIETYPVVLSTRSNGLLPTTRPSITMLNYFLPYAKVDSAFYLIDATDNLVPFPLLPERCLNKRARITDKKKSDWLSISPMGKDKTVSYYELSLNDDLELSGKLSYADHQYAAINFRKKYEEFNSHDEYLVDFLKDKSGLVVHQININNIDDIYKPIKRSFDVTITDQVFEDGSEIYLNLIPYDAIKENPYNNKERKYPVDYPYPVDKMGVVKVNIPEGYTVVEVPENANIVLPENAASFTYTTKVVGNTIIINYRYKIKKLVYDLYDYQLLGSFFNHIISKQTEQIILKKDV